MIKKPLILIFLFAIFTVSAPLPVYAEQVVNYDFMRVTDYDTAIYNQKDGLGFLFYLPYSYYVKVLEHQGEYAHVECYDHSLTPTIDGYVLISKLSECASPTVSPFLTQKITTIKTTTLYSNPECTFTERLIFPDRELGYYGKADIVNGEQVFFVCYLGQTGYVKESTISPFIVTDHPTPVNPIAQAPTTETPRQTTSDYKTLKIAILISLLLAGIIGAFAVIKRKTASNTAVSVFDELDS
ncbi:MAG: hypothetical protein IKZ38_04785 [Clostridia bacterium]|nr:hypothetical protein [Clostridia bacterium]